MPYIVNVFMSIIAKWEQALALQWQTQSLNTSTAHPFSGLTRQFAIQTHLLTIDVLFPPGSNCWCWRRANIAATSYVPLLQYWH